MPASVYGTIYEGGGVNSLLQSLVSEFSFSTQKTVYLKLNAQFL